ncbi:MAG: hypothetical protein IJ501_00770 [Bacilli bacterium]|nr:hypothetical protein [Bacilli bacterium]
MKIGIIGCGAYGIALSSLFDLKNIELTMWTKLEDEYEELVNNRTNKLNDKIKFTISLEEITLRNEALILAIPAKFLKDVIFELKKYYNGQHILIATKGMIDSNLISSYLHDELNTEKIACISGPSFASDILKKEIIGLTLASNNVVTLDYFRCLFKDTYLDIEITHDIIGVQLNGILKNTMAIASGILDGIKVSKSTKAKFLTDISKEIKKIINNLGGDFKTFDTYSGIGDLLLTTTSQESRNYTFGLLIGENKDFKSYLENNTVEGVENLRNIKNLFKKNRIKSRIIDILFEIVYLSQPKEKVIEYLKNGN